MNGRSLSQKYRFWRGLACAFLAASGLSASRAAASCGDYVMVGGKPMASHSLATNAGQQDLLKHSTENAAELPAPCGCTGPSCSRDSIPTTPLPNAPVAVDQWGVFSAEDSFPPPGSSRLTTAKRPIAGDGHLLAIFRPPR